MRFWDLQRFQQEHKKWLSHNFPGQTDHQALLGVIEEVGELAHAHLKHEQGIRGYDDAKYRKEAGDAIGDIIVYLASYCNTNGFDLDLCLELAWEEVSNRDWKHDPTRGTASSHAEQSSG